ncbi:sugar porter family MFS transporter [Gilliamella sp. wkB112]|uniref:sugar porter family MFS transporter n=1 Tax=Gilliamella sp. wkB112 TaxID=3120257 RepID=UPI00080EADA2|nr:sugar porter family MFS transporter [Gilliamella apicola]OCG04734.1 MFS transporter [Gilliamella apicola]
MITQNEQVIKKKLSFITLVATIGGLCFGYDTGVISGALIFMTTDLGLSPIAEGFVTSSLLFGAAFGAVSGGMLSDKYGRRKTMLFVAFIFIFGALATSLSWNFTSMVISRFVLGVAVGCASVIVPVYIAEIAPIGRRERLVTVNELMIVTGQFLAYSVNAGIVNFAPELNHNWRIMLAIPAAPGALLWLGMLFLPESPRFLIKMGFIDTARKVLKTVRTDNIEKEILDVKTLSTQNHKINIFEELNKKWVIKLIFIGLAIVLATRVTGVNTIMYYSPTVLKSTGLGDAAAVTGAVANGLISILATILGIILIGKHSRRKMFFTGQVGVLTSLVFIGLTFKFCFHIELIDGNETVVGNFTGASYLVLFLMLVFLTFMQGWIAPVFWLMLSEIFPLHLRGLGMGIAVFGLFIFDFMIQSIFPWLLSSYGGGATFGIFAVANIIMLLVLLKYLPETRNLTLEEIETKFRK